MVFFSIRLRLAVSPKPPGTFKISTICQLTKPTVINYYIVKSSAIFNKKKTTTIPRYFLFSFPKTPFFITKKKKTKNTHIPCPNKTILKSERKKSAYLTKHQINLITCFLAQIFIYLPKSNIDSLCFECLQRYWYDAYPTRFFFYFFLLVFVSSVAVAVVVLCVFFHVFQNIC